MTPEELDLITATAPMVAGDPDGFADTFYRRLFEVAPTVRSLFASDLSDQKGKLVSEVEFLIGASRDLDAFTARARDLGRRHVDYGVTAADYAHVEDALLTGLAAAAGDRWSDAHHQAWCRLYALISETMLDGAAGTLFSPADQT